MALPRTPHQQHKPSLGLLITISQPTASPRLPPSDGVLTPGTLPDTLSPDNHPQHPSLTLTPSALP